MRIPRLRPVLADLIGGIDGVTAVELYETDPGMRDLKVIFDDGIVMYLKVVTAGGPQDDPVVVKESAAAGR